jgi:hypothetical protein
MTCILPRAAGFNFAEQTNLLLCIWRGCIYLHITACIVYTYRKQPAFNVLSSHPETKQRGFNDHSTTSATQVFVKTTEENRTFAQAKILFGFWIRQYWQNVNRHTRLTAPASNSLHKDFSQ